MGTEYTINVPAEGTATTIDMDYLASSGGVVSHTMTYSSSGVYSETWITDVQVYGMNSGYSASWRSLILSEGVRYGGIEIYVLEGYGTRLKLKATCTKNTTGQTRSFRGKLSGRNDYLTIRQPSTSGGSGGSAPANDNFDSAISLPGASGNTTGTNTGATTQTSEPKPKKQQSAGYSVWYKWTAPSSGTATFDTIGSNFDTVLAIYTGSTVSSLTEIDSHDDIDYLNGNTASRVVFAANSGTTYRIAVYGFNNGSGNTFNLNWSLTGGSTGGGTKYALCVGIDNYNTAWFNQQGFSFPGDGSGSLCGCVNDSMYFRNNLVNRGGWSSANVTRLTDGNATKTAIRTAIRSYASKAVPGDIFIYEHSSHGFSKSDSAGNDTKEVALCVYSDLYWDWELAADLALFPSGVKVVVIADTCNSGGLFKGAGSRPSFDIAARVSALLDKRRAKETTAGARSATRGIQSSEIGWATAAEYDKTSSDFGCYDSTTWMQDWDYRWSNIGGVCGGAFTTAMTWGWWTGAADSNNSGGVDVYEGFSYAKTVLAAIGRNPPVCYNQDVLRSVVLGARGGCPTSPILTIDDFGGMGNTSSITLSWSGAQNATSYSIYRGTSIDRPTSPIRTGITSTTFTDNNSLSPGVIYYYWVEAKNASGSAFSPVNLGNTVIPLRTAVDNNELTFTTGGGVPWWGIADPSHGGLDSHDGTDAATSGNVGDNGNSWMQTTVSGPGTLSFWWRVSCEFGISSWYDYLEVLVDGNVLYRDNGEKLRIDGETDWEQVSLAIGAGLHEIKWNYHKDGSDLDGIGMDCGWVDQVVWRPGESSLDYEYAEMAVSRLRNPYTGEYLYSGDENEMANMVRNGWIREGVVFGALSKPYYSAAPLHRFMNRFTGFHLFTMDENERAALAAASNIWAYEGVACYVDSSANGELCDTEAIYRARYAVTGQYILTSDPNERAALNADPFWTVEGIAFWAMNPLNMAGSRAVLSASGTGGEELPPSVVPEASGAALVPVFRMRNVMSGDAMFTTDSDECAELAATGIWDWEGEAFKAFDGPVSGTMPLRRLSCPVTGELLYTVSNQERDNLVESGFWIEDGIVCYVGTSAQDGATPVSQFVSPCTEFSVFSLDVGEMEALLAEGWLDEGVVFYVW